MLSFAAPGKMLEKPRQEQVWSKVLQAFLSSRSTLLSPSPTQESWVETFWETFKEIFGHSCCLKQMCISSMIIEIKFSILEILLSRVSFSTAKAQSQWKKPLNFPISRFGLLGSCLLGFRLLFQIQTRTFLSKFSKGSFLFDEICHCRTDLIFFNCYMNPKTRLDGKEH